MAGDDSHSHFSLPTAYRVLDLLGELQHTPAGAVLYKQIERIINDAESARMESERLYSRLLETLLDAYIEHLVPGTPLHVQVKLIQKQLQPPLSNIEINALRGYIDLYANHISKMQTFDQGALKRVLEPLLHYYGGDRRNSAPPALDPQPEFYGMPGVQEPFRESPENPREAMMMQPGVDAPPQYQSRSQDEPVDSLTPQNQNRTEQNLASTYRRYLSTQQKDMEKIQTMLEQRIKDTIEQTEQFGVILEVTRNGLVEAKDTGELDHLRQHLIREVDKLSSARQVLVSKLGEAHHYLQIVETDSHHLNDELARVRLLSLTDELTELPNRRAFLRRLEDEVGRVQRYGFPLSLVMIDLDNFKNINDTYGHAMGDTVLRHYAKQVLSIFRHHDMVARYGGEEFAVLLPNTDTDGARSSLQKVRKRAAGIKCEHAGTLLDVPTFSAGLSHYRPGETPSTFIQRADEALYRAKNLGRNRIEVDVMPAEGAESSGDR